MLAGVEFKFPSSSCSRLAEDAPATAALGGREPCTRISAKGLKLFSTPAPKIDDLILNDTILHNVEDAPSVKRDRALLVLNTRLKEHVAAYLLCT